MLLKYCAFLNHFTKENDDIVLFYDLICYEGYWQLNKFSLIWKTNYFFWCCAHNKHLYLLFLKDADKMFWFFQNNVLKIAISPIIGFFWLGLTQMATCHFLWLLEDSNILNSCQNWLACQTVSPHSMFHSSLIFF